MGGLICAFCFSPNQNPIVLRGKCQTCKRVVKEPVSTARIRGKVIEITPKEIKRLD